MELHYLIIGTIGRFQSDYNLEIEDARSYLLILFSFLFCLQFFCDFVTLLLVVLFRERYYLILSVNIIIIENTLPIRRKLDNDREAPIETPTIQFVPIPAIVPITTKMNTGNIKSNNDGCRVF